MEKRTQGGISALLLRAIACGCMLLDHVGYLWAGRYPALQILRYIGRLAFPIFVFLLVNGYRHTRSRLRYALRLLVFALISQVPFGLCLYRDIFHTGNVFFTLLISLLCLWATDCLWQRKKTRALALLPSIAVCGLYYFGLLRSDYGMKGVLLALVFFFFDGRKLLTVLGSFFALYSPTLLGYGMGLFQLMRGRSYVFRLPNSWGRTQLFALLALVPIFFYRGKKGRSPKNPIAAKALQYGFYLFYPVHLTGLLLMHTYL